MMHRRFLVLLVTWTGVASLALGKTPAAQPVLRAENVTALQSEPEDPATGRYDWGPCVMRDEGVYKMWFVRLGGANRERFPYAGRLPDGERFEFTYPDRGDRIYYAESRDGRTWNISGDDYPGTAGDFGPDARGPLMVLGPAETDQQRMHLGNPSVIKTGGAYYMYYEACSVFILRRGPDGAPAVGDEYHNQIFLATSQDGKIWSHVPDTRSPQPIIRAPVENLKPGRQRYGLGQPSVCWKDGTYIMHYVDSCTAPGDFIVRVEAANPHFRNARTFYRSLASVADVRCPAGAVARFAQTDVKYRRDAWYLIRPAYGTGRIGLLASREGVFGDDARSILPRDVFPQIDAPDPRGPQYRERLYPRFLTTPAGEILVEKGRAVIYYSSGLGFKDKAYTWDLRRCELPIDLVSDSVR